MNPSPRLRWLGNESDPTYNPGCGHLAMRNVEQSFWQSRMTRAGAPAALPSLADLPAMARDLRATWEPANGH